jgi:hypothetical protein
MSKKADQQRQQMSLSLRSRLAGEEPETPQPRTIAPRVKPVRITVDLEPDLHRRLKVWAVESDDSKLAEVVRVLAERMLDDPELAEQVRQDLHRRREQ